MLNCVFLCVLFWWKSNFLCLWKQSHKWYRLLFTSWLEAFCVVPVEVVSFCRVFFSYEGIVLAVHDGRNISYPLFAWDFCSYCGSDLRHGGHWYIPWESTGYPNVIIAASWIILGFFVLFMISLGISFQMEDNVCSHFYIFVFHRQPGHC